MGLYLLGTLAALLSAGIANKLLKMPESNNFFIELPDYQLPYWRNVVSTTWNRVRSFVVDAGKIILVFSIVIWLAASYGPPQQMQQAEEAAQQIALQNQLSAEEAQNLEASLKMENSFAGQLGHFIEPAIRPLGYDWKIGIALLTSFAAREVFVGTMSTLYSIGTEANEATLTEKLRAEKAADGSPMFTVALAVSLSLFYAFAMQCMSTVAVVRRETGSWKWPLIQLVYMTSLAYISSFMAFQLLS